MAASRGTRSEGVAGAADDINALRAKGGLTLFNFGPDARGGISAGYRTFGKLLGYALREDNLAQDKTATQSSTYSDGARSYGPGEAVDGIFKHSEGIAHTTATDNPWWKVDLGRDELIGTVVLFNTSDTRVQQRLSNLKVEVLNAAGEAVNTSATLNPNNGLSSPQGLIVHFGNGVSGRSVRITRDTTGKTNDTDKYLALSEVMVFSPTSVAITTPKSAHNGSAFTATFTFSEPVKDFTATDITITGGTLSNFSGGTGTTYTATITPARTVVLNVAANVATNAAGNGNTAATPVRVDLDTTRPRVSIDAPSAHNGSAFTATFIFSEPVSGFDAAADIAVTGGTATAPTEVTGADITAGTRYRATITPDTPASGAALADITLDVPAAAAQDAAGNANLTATPVSVDLDTTRPRVSIDVPSAHNGSAFTATFIFGEPVSGFDAAADITVTGSTTTAPTEVTGADITAGTRYRATITPDTPASGAALADITLDVPAAAAQDAAGNANLTATPVRVDLDTTRPRVSIDAPSAHNGRAFTATFIFGEPVSGFDAAADLTVTGGTATAPTEVTGADITAGTRYRATITPDTPASGAALADITLAVPAAAAQDAAGNDNTAAAQVTVTADTDADADRPGVTITTGGLQDVSIDAPITRLSERGDLALVPYYTVADDWVTGIHIVNTSEHTQVVKVRFRRATDAMNALDFNLVLSPRDVYAGFLSDDANGTIAWTSPDSTCTTPAAQDQRLTMPDIYRAGAETGYVEIIAMGRPTDETQPIAVAAKHRAASPSATGASTASAPLDCDAVRSNFFADGSSATGKPGVVNRSTTWQRANAAFANAASANATLKTGGRNTYVDSGDVLKVSYFIRDNATGIEFGDNAVHISNFLGAPALTNQQYSVLSGDLNGFDFPDLNGGVPLSGAGGASIERARFKALRAPGALGVSAMLNEWSTNPANGVEMDWVVTLPGQYVMLKLPQYAAALAGAGRPWAPTVNSAGRLVANRACPRDPIPASGTAPAVAECDYRDQPVQLSFTAYNREKLSSAGGTASELVVSPPSPGTTVRTFLPKVANVISFGGNSALGRTDVTVNANLGQPYGWISASVQSVDSGIRVCDWDFADDRSSGFSTAAGDALKGKLVCSTVTGGVPVIGFAAWSRQIDANPNASYGRIVEHSYRVSP